MAKNRTVAVKYKKRVLRVEAKVVDVAALEKPLPPCAWCNQKTLKAVETVIQQGIWWDEFLTMCFCSKCETATVFRAQYGVEENEH